MNEGFIFMEKYKCLDPHRGICYFQYERFQKYGSHHIRIRILIKIGGNT